MISLKLAPLYVIASELVNVCLFISDPSKKHYDRAWEDNFNDDYNFIIIIITNIIIIIRHEVLVGNPWKKKPLGSPTAEKNFKWILNILLM
jgi:hypothetical protein